MEAGTVTYAGRDGDYRAGDHSADYTWQRAFHARADHGYARFHQAAAVAQQAVNAGYAYVVDGVYFIAHDFGSDLSFFSHKDVAGAGADYGDFAFAVDLGLA